jgi:hypothetical protein
MTLHWETISPTLRQVMAFFARSEIGQRFYLAGGTGLALQLGHRRSVDLDYFTSTEDVPSIRQPLMEAFKGLNPVLASTAWGNLLLLVSGVRMGFYGYGFPLVVDLLDAEGTRLASVPDIALMKLDALLSRASRKDFIDLYEICQHISLRELFDLASQKYPATRDFEIQVVKHMVFFERAEQEEMPVLLEPIDWSTVKAFFIQQANDFGKSWLG